MRLELCDCQEFCDCQNRYVGVGISKHDSFEVYPCSVSPTFSGSQAVLPPFSITYECPKLSSEACVQDHKRPSRPGNERGDMRRRIIALLMFAVLGSAFALGENGDRRDLRNDRIDHQQDRRDIRSDKRDIRQDRRQVRNDLRNGNYRAARQQQRDIRHDKRDLRADRRDVRHDRRDIRHDRRDVRRDHRG